MERQTIIIAISIVLIALLIVIVLQTRKNKIKHIVSETAELNNNQADTQ